QAFLNCYQGFARDVAMRAPSSRWKTLQPELIARQVMHQGIDSKLRLYRFEHWIPAKWGDLHALFQTACSEQIERHPVPLYPGGPTTTIELEYVRILVLQLMDSGNLTPRHLDWVDEQLSEWCAPCRLGLEAASVTTFYVDLGTRAGLR